MQVNSALMIHGAGGGGWEWAVWSRVFGAAGWCVSAPDLMPAAEGIAATAFAHYEAQVRTWIHAARPRLIIGASLGGLLALRCHDVLPKAALVLVNPLPPAGIAGTASPRKDYPAIVPWRRGASLASTARALPDADASTWHYAWRRWRDESGAVMNAATQGLPIDPPEAPVLMLISGEDDDVPPCMSHALAAALHADTVELRGASHVGPLLGRDASEAAERVLAWWRMRS